MEKIKEYVKDHAGVIILAIIAVICVVWLGCKIEAFVQKSKEVPIKTVQAITPKDIQTAFPMSYGDAKAVSERIVKVTETQPPTHTYITYTQETADKTAESYAKADKADKVIKTTTDITPAGKQAGDPSVFQNNYYAVQMERKHAISIGAAAVDGNAYATVGYRNRRTEYEVMYGPANKNVGVAIKYEVARW